MNKKTHSHYKKEIILLSLTLYSAFAHGQNVLDKTLYKPMPLPHYTPSKDSNNTQNFIITYNVSQKSFDTVDMSSQPSRQSVSYPSQSLAYNEFIPSQQQAYSFSPLQPADQMVGYPSYPITTIVKLYLTFFNPATQSVNNVTCSGALINCRYIITAGHCVKNPQDGSYVTACTVVPEYNMGNSPFGFTTTTTWSSFSQWTGNGNWDYDMAIMSLADPIGTYTGWLGWGYNIDNSFFTSSANSFHSFGYPAQDDFGNTVFEGGERMYHMSGNMDNWQGSNTMCNNNIGYHGQSGSAIYYLDASSNRYVYGVLSHGNGISPPYYTCHCRMDANMFNNFNSIISPCGPLNITEDQTHNKQHQIAIYPNPSVNYCMIDLSDVSFQQIDLVLKNVLGEEMKRDHITSKIDSYTLEMSAYSEGLYFLSIMIDGVPVSGKILKSR